MSWRSSWGRGCWAQVGTVGGRAEVQLGAWLLGGLGGRCLERGPGEGTASRGVCGRHRVRQEDKAQEATGVPASVTSGSYCGSMLLHAAPFAASHAPCRCKRQQ